MSVSSSSTLPVAIIGAGPIGLAAAQLAQRGETPLVLEAGPTVGAQVHRWGHVRMFSPWRYTIDAAARQLLEAASWQAPAPDVFPTGHDLVEQYLVPLGALPQIAPHLRLNTRVVAVTRQGFDKVKTVGRDNAPFLLHIRTADGHDEHILARAVIDASGTYATPNPLGASGIFAPGEAALADEIYYGIPDVFGRDRARYAGKRVLVVGSGHSAFNALLDLAKLAHDIPMIILWAIRRVQMGQLWGGGTRDLLPARGSLGERVRQLVEDGTVQLITDAAITRLDRTAQGIVATTAHGALPPVDQIIATTGFRPDLAPLRELRLALDGSLESPTALAPLIAPNLHSCGTVYPHGAVELAHPEPGFYIVGMKSYGRAPTFLLLTGYEQVRSVVAALTGNWESAQAVELVLPETGVCSSSFGAGGDSSAEASSCPPAAETAARTEAIGLTPINTPVSLAVAPVATTVSCCTSSVQASCCEAEAKAACCGGPTSTSSLCGCK
jgi:hypothetical protein